MLKLFRVHAHYPDGSCFDPETFVVSRSISSAMDLVREAAQKRVDAMADADVPFPETVTLDCIQSIVIVDDDGEDGDLLVDPSLVGVVH